MVVGQNVAVLVDDKSRTGRLALQRLLRLDCAGSGFRPGRTGGRDPSGFRPRLPRLLLSGACPRGLTEVRPFWVQSVLMFTTEGSSRFTSLDNSFGCAVAAGMVRGVASGATIWSLAANTPVLISVPITIPTERVKIISVNESSFWLAHLVKENHGSPSTANINILLLLDVPACQTVSIQPAGFLPECKMRPPWRAPTTLHLLLDTTSTTRKQVPTQKSVPFASGVVSRCAHV